MARERWREVVNCEGFEVSDRGNVCDARKRGTRLVVKQHRLKNGYAVVNVRRSVGKWKAYLVHRLVLEAFSKPCPEFCEARWRDEDQSNNRLENLYWEHRGLNRIGQARNQYTYDDEDAIEDAIKKSLE